MEVLSVTNDNSIWAAMIVFGAIAFFLFLVAWDRYDRKKWIQTTVCLLLSLGFLIEGFSFCKTHDDKKVLKVIITDMSKVDLSKYKITDNEGKIITLKEK